MGNVPRAGLRQPPPPRRCSDSSLMGEVLDPRSNMSPSMRQSKEGNAPKRRAYYFRRCKKVRPTTIESLPNEVLWEILIRLSANDICENARLVCRKWYHIIHSEAFVYAHLDRAAWGLVLSYALVWYEYPVFVVLDARQGRIEISKLCGHKCQCPIWASSNGLILWRELSKVYAPCIFNPATNQAFYLPPFVQLDAVGNLGIAYAAPSMEYKVVRAYFLGARPMKMQCDILTVGVDNSWRSIGIEKLSRISKQLLFHPQLVTEGFMHWAREGIDRVLSLNVENETFRESHLPVPQDFQGTRREYFLSTGRYLTLLIKCGDLMWEVWEMKPETGEWRKVVPNIDLEAQKRRVEEFAYESCGLLKPLGWVKYPVVLALCFSSGEGCTCIVYNLQTDEIHTIDLPVPCAKCKPEHPRMVKLIKDEHWGRDRSYLIELRFYAFISNELHIMCLGNPLNLGIKAMNPNSHLRPSNQSSHGVAAFPRFKFQTTPLDPGTSVKASTEKSISSEAAAEQERNGIVVENGPHSEASSVGLPGSRSCADSNVEVELPSTRPARRAIYHLVSVVEHFGSSGGGHYTVYRKVTAKIGDEDTVALLESATEGWFCISDSQVDSVSEREVLDANASVLFYEKLDNS